MHPFLQQYFKLVKKLIPSSSDEPSVGLDIGTDTCKLVEIQKKDNGYELLNAIIEPVEKGQISLTLKKILGQLKKPTKLVYTSVSGKGTLIRYVDMPKMSIEDLRNSLSIEADKYFPFAQDQIYTDCYIIDSKAQGQQMPVMVAAVKKEIIDERMKLLSELDLQADCIGLNSVALANVWNVLDHPSSKEKEVAVAIIDIGDSVSSLSILVNGVPRFNRDIMMGGRDLTKRIANTLNVPFDEAERLKESPGNRAAEVASACESGLVNLLQEVKLSFDYFMTEKNKEVVKIFLTGGGSLFSGMTEMISKHLEVKTEFWDPLRTLIINPSVNQDKLKTQSPRLGVALGLALYSYDTN
jgi:type IV pilus assembly protein PilM